ncbi:plasmid segregation protein ParM domain-containing protein [Vibrio mediterranei]|uniref:plasmid segregation protein ParM domain-containing protein n=1 Tax=Vibrio mediterranei TaxID=689 RepID=UPI00406865FB
MDLVISCDDGSQQAKLSWLCPETGELKKLVVPNSMRKGFKSAALRSDVQVYNYTIGSAHEERRFTYDVTSEDAVNTSHLDWQYSAECVISLHHALLQTGLCPKRYPNIKVIATLPITEYYRLDDLQKNLDAIERKKENLLRPVNLVGGETFNIVEVEVMPESAPAAMSILANDDSITPFSRSLIVDLGGVTLDMCTVAGRFEELTNVTGNSDLGVSWVTKTAKAALMEADTEVSWHVANLLIKNRHDREFVSQVIINHDKIDYVLSKIETRISELGDAVAAEARRFCQSPNRVLLVGGGSPLILKAMKEAYPNLGDKVMVVPGAESVLAVENMRLNAEEAREVAA